MPAANIKKGGADRTNRFPLERQLHCRPCPENGQNDKEVIPVPKNHRQTAPRRRFPSRLGLFWLGVVLLGTAVSIGLLRRTSRESVVSRPDPPPTDETDRMAPIPGGTFRMGNDFSPYSDQRPAHDVSVAPFSMDTHEVTNRQFARFVAQSDYLTTAEQQGWSYRFDRATNQWRRTPGADWRHPGGPHTNIAGREDRPVVHVSWYDADAYARWVGCRLPTEVEWERAARAGLCDADFPWGRKETVNGKYQANYWQGWFPDDDLTVDGFDTLAPVGSFEPNGFGLFDVAGNVWEWCADRYGEDYYRISPRDDPRGPTEGEMRVQRGGSWLSAENYGPGYRVSVRSKRPPDASYEDVGFRCARSASAERR